MVDRAGLLYAAGATAVLGAGAFLALPTGGLSAAVAFSAVPTVAEAISGDLFLSSWGAVTRRAFAGGGELNHDLQRALRRAMRTATRRMKKSWAATMGRSAWVGALGRDAVSAFEGLSEDAERLLGTSLSDDALEATRALMERAGDLQSSVRSQIEERLKGMDQQVVEFIATELPRELALCFGEELKADTDDGRRAWRAYQRVALDALMVEQRGMRAEVLAAVQAISQQLDALPAGGRLETGLAALAHALDGLRATLIGDLTRALGDQTQTLIDVLADERRQDRDAIAAAVRAGNEALLDRMLTLAPLLPVHGVNAARVAAHSERWLEAHKSDPFGYIPAVYTPRPEIEAALDAFLLGDRSGFLLLGEAGIGKSSVLCRMVERWRERGEAVFAFDGRTLSGDEDIEEQARKAADFDGTVETFIAQIRNQSGRMVLVVDGVDRSTHPTVLLQRLCGVIRNRAPATGDDRPTAVRVVISFRRTLFELALKDIGIVRDDQHVFARDAFQTRPVERQGRTEQTVENVLERVGENQELEAMYERYRAFEGGSRFCPRTTFQSLGPAARKALSQPLFLRLAMETYHGQHIPGDERDEEGAREPLWTGRILEDFSTLKLDRVASGRGLVEELVTTLRKQQATGMFVADLPEVSRRWQQAFIAGAGGRSAYRALRDEGILVETEREVMDNGRLRRREWVSFTSDQLFEYLLAADVLAQYAGEPDAVALASVLEESQEFRSMAGAAAHLLTRAAQSGRPELLAETLDADTSGADLPVLVRVLTTLEGMGSADFEPSVNAIAGAVHRPWACRVLLAAAGEFAERRRPRPMLHCSQWAVARARKLVNDSAEVELLELATALHSQGYALIELGQLPEALGAYDEAIGLYRQLVDGEGRRELRNDLAGVLVNKAILIEGPEFRNWDEALGLYQDAIVLREGCVADGMTHLLADLLRTIRYRVMTLLDLGRWVDTADDVVRVLDHTQTAGQSGELSEAAAGEASALLALLAGLPASHRDAVYAALGEWEQIVRVIVDGGDGGAEGE